MYDKLKHVIPGTAIGTTLDQLDLKLKEAQSDPLMKELMCQYRYEQILVVTKTLVAKGVFEIDQGSTLSYLAACKAAKRAKDIAEKGDDIAQSSGSGEEDTSAPGPLQSTVSKANPLTTSENKSIATSDIAVNQFDSLLQEHSEASKSPSTTPAVSPNLETVEIAEHVFSEQSTVGSELDTKTAEALDSSREWERVPLNDKQGLYYEDHLEKLYQILKPDLKGNDYNAIGRNAMLKRNFKQILETNSELQEARQRHGIEAVRHLLGSLAVRGFFLVDYDLFPSYREAAEEASKLVPQYPKLVTSTQGVVSDDNGMPSITASTTARQQPAGFRKSSDLEQSDTTQSFGASALETQHDHSTNASAAMHLETKSTTEALKEHSQTNSWKSIKFPNMYEIEPSISRDAVPEFWKMKFFPAQEKLEVLHNIARAHAETANPMDYVYIRLPSMQELESCSDHDSELNVNGLRLLGSEPPESPTPMLVQNPTEPIFSAKAEVITDEQNRKPSKVLFVSGIGRGINIKHLFKEFADVCPVNINFDTSKRVAVIEFTDIEAATKALKAKHGVFLSGRALNCEFGSESSLHDQVGIPTIASEQPTDGHKDDESPISEEIVVNEQFGTPSKFLYVVGIARSVNIERLFEEFADVSPVDISHVGSWPFAFFEFTNIEAATKAIKAKHGTFLCGKKLRCVFSRSENPFTKSVGIRTGASKQPIDDHGYEGSSVPEPPKVEDMIFAPTTITTDTIAVSTGTTVGTVAQVPEEIMKESVGKAPTDITAEAVRYAPTQTVDDELMLSSEPEPLDQTTSLRKIPKRQRKVQKAKATQSMTREPAPNTETRLDKPVFETLSKSTKDQEETTTVEPPGATSDDEPLYDGGVYNESASSSSIDQATFHELEEDNLTYANEPSSSDELNSKVYQELLRNTGLRKGPVADRVLPEIRQYATIPVPRTRAYYLPYSSQNRTLSGLQASLEQVCFRYLQRRHPELLEETPTRWGIDSAHAFELNRYIYLLRGLIAPSPGVDLGPGGSRSLQALIRSIAGLRHHAVHRFRVDIEALRFWAVDAARLAELLDDPEAARQFSSLVSSLEAQHNRMKADKMKAEEDLLVTVRELAVKRAELLRVEREAMTAYEAAHKQLPTRTSELDKVIDANIPLDHGFGVEWKETSSVEGTSSAKPTSGIFGRIKSWFGA
ncbi:hypothetical protein KCU64_g6002, partial [Aureobasidium melanogenum]